MESLVPWVLRSIMALPGSVSSLTAFGIRLCAGAHNHVRLTALDQIEKDTDHLSVVLKAGKRIQDAVPTGSLCYDLNSGGGLPPGRARDGSLSSGPRDLLGG